MASSEMDDARKSLRAEASLKKFVTSPFCIRNFGTSGGSGSSGRNLLLDDDLTMLELMFSSPTVLHSA